VIPISSKKRGGFADGLWLDFIDGISGRQATRDRDFATSAFCEVIRDSFSRRCNDLIADNCTTQDIRGFIEVFDRTTGWIFRQH
jgi:hypothetical protein